MSFPNTDILKNLSNDEILDKCSKKFDEFKRRLNEKSILNLELSTIEVDSVRSEFEIKRYNTNLSEYINTINKCISYIENKIELYDKFINKMIRDIEIGYMTVGDTKIEYDEEYKKATNDRIKLLQNDISTLREVISLLSPQIAKAQQCINHNFSVINSL